MPLVLQWLAIRWRTTVKSSSLSVVDENVGTMTSDGQSRAYDGSGRKVIANPSVAGTTSGNGSLDQRLYATSDANFDVTGIFNTSGTAQERFLYDSIGTIFHSAQTMELET
jgi:hypothetical protein